MVEVQGILGSIIFDGRWVTITKRGQSVTMKGVWKLELSQISSITLKPATRLYHGYIQFTVPGTSAAPVLKSGLAAGRPSREDRDSLSFSHKNNDDFLKLQEAVEAAIEAGGNSLHLDVADQLRKLADLRDTGILNEDELQEQKAKLLRF